MSLCRGALSAAHLQQAKYSAELKGSRAAALFYKTNLDNKDAAGSELTETALIYFFLCVCIFFSPCPSYFVSDSPHRQRIQYGMSSQARAGITLLNTLLILPLDKNVNGLPGSAGGAMRWNLGTLIGSREMLARVQR